MKKQLRITILAIIVLVALVLGIYLLSKNNTQRQTGSEMTEFSVNFAKEHPEWILCDTVYTRELKIELDSLQLDRDNSNVNQQISVLLTWACAIETDTAGGYSGDLTDIYHIAWVKMERTDSNKNVKLYKMLFSKPESIIDYEVFNRGLRQDQMTGKFTIKYGFFRRISCEFDFDIYGLDGVAYSYGKPQYKKHF